MLRKIFKECNFFVKINIILIKTIEKVYNLQYNKLIKLKFGGINGIYRV